VLFGRFRKVNFTSCVRRNANLALIFVFEIFKDFLLVSNQQINMKTFNNQDVKFNFEELNFHTEIDGIQDLVYKVHTKQLDGFILKEVFNQHEVQTFLDKVSAIPSQQFLQTNTGTIIPDPFATISNLEDRLKNYADKKVKFEDFGFHDEFKKLDFVMKFISQPFEVRPPQISNYNIGAVPATIRHFYPDMGGLFVHCGYLFQVQTPIYYDAVEKMEKEGQLSFFVVMQQPEIGGELTLYDMVWDNVNKKDSAENNEYVLDKYGNRVLLSEVNSRKYNPSPGDILVFYGGRIWHRVEPIFGSRPRITLGGFINFSKDDKICFYWS
jgi:hapalindole-type alkaloid chlorinase